MEVEDTIKEGYVDRKFNEITKEEQVGLSPMGLVALALLLKSGVNQELPEWADSLVQKTKPDEKEFVGKKLFEDGYVETRFDRKTAEQQFRITEKAKELIHMLSFFTKDLK